MICLSLMRWDPDPCGNGTPALKINKPSLKERTVPASPWQLGSRPEGFSEALFSECALLQFPHLQQKRTFLTVCGNTKTPPPHTYKTLMTMSD